MHAMPFAPVEEAEGSTARGLVALAAPQRIGVDVTRSGGTVYKIQYDEHTVYVFRYPDGTTKVSNSAWGTDNVAHYIHFADKASMLRTLAASVTGRPTPLPTFASLTADPELLELCRLASSAARNGRLPITLPLAGVAYARACAVLRDAIPGIRFEAAADGGIVVA